MGEENSIAFLIRAHPRNRGSSPLLLGVMATWRFNWIPFERHENLRSPRKSRRVAARMGEEIPAEQKRGIFLSAFIRGY
jgi:hypothetical protein